MEQSMCKPPWTPVYSCDPSGQHFEIRDEGSWWAGISDDEWPPCEKQRRVILQDFDGATPFGDRRCTPVVLCWSCWGRCVVPCILCVDICCPRPVVLAKSGWYLSLQLSDLYKKRHRLQHVQLYYEDCFGVQFTRDNFFRSTQELG